MSVPGRLLSADRGRTQKDKSVCSASLDDVSLSGYSLPSLVAIPKSRTLTSQLFVGSQPVSRRGLYSCFGIGEDDDPECNRIFARSAMRTPPKIRQSMLEMKKEAVKSTLNFICYQCNLIRLSGCPDKTKKTKKIEHLEQEQIENKLVHDVKKIAGKEKEYIPGAYTLKPRKSKAEKSTTESPKFHEDSTKVFFLSANDKKVQLEGFLQIIL
jgi:hypothetical protein